MVKPPSKKLCFRTSSNSQHVKASQILLKSAWELIYQIYSSLRQKLIWKISPLVISEKLGVFVNTMTAGDKYPVRDCDNLLLPIQMEFFLNFLFHLWNLHQILNFLNRKMIVIANVFLKWWTVKVLVKPLSKKLCLTISFDSELVKGSQTLMKSLWEHFYHIFSSLRGEMIWKISPLLKFEMLGMSFNALSDDHKYPVYDSQNLWLTIQMNLS